MKKISIILLFLAAVCPLAQAQRVKVYVTDAWDKPLGEVAVTLGRGRIPVAVTGADGMAEVDAGEGDRMTLTLLNRMSRTVAVSGGEMHIRLTDDDVLFDVGYDERVRKGSASASLAGAAAREIEAGGRTDLMSNLYGLIPGLGVRPGREPAMGLGARPECARRWFVRREQCGRTGRRHRTRCGLPGSGGSGAHHRAEGRRIAGTLR